MQAMALGSILYGKVTVYPDKKHEITFWNLNPELTVMVGAAGLVT
jgi:hypothetical protein